MTPTLITSCAVAAAWILMASLIPLLRERHRFAAFWVMVMLGVPVLGWLTLKWGPGIGVGAFALGLWILLRQPFCLRRARMGRALGAVAQPPEQGHL